MEITVVPIEERGFLCLARCVLSSFLQQTPSFKCFSAFLFRVKNYFCSALFTRLLLLLSHSVLSCPVLVRLVLFVNFLVHAVRSFTAFGVPQFPTIALIIMKGPGRNNMLPLFFLLPISLHTFHKHWVFTRLQK